MKTQFRILHGSITLWKHPQQYGIAKGSRKKGTSAEKICNWSVSSSDKAKHKMEKAEDWHRRAQQTQKREIKRWSRRKRHSETRCRASPWKTQEKREVDYIVRCYRHTLMDDTGGTTGTSPLTFWHEKFAAYQTVAASRTNFWKRIITVRSQACEPNRLCKSTSTCLAEKSGRRLFSMIILWNNAEHEKE